MKEEAKKPASPANLDRETLSQLDDEQLKQIAGGANGGNADDPDEEESCSYVGGCQDCCNKQFSAE